MDRARLLPILVLTACAGAPAPPPPEAGPLPAAPEAPEGPEAPGASAPLPERADWHEATSDDGTYSVRWRPAERAAVPVNEPFELELRLARGGQPLAGARLAVRAWMPAHRHGMLRTPVVDDLGDGRYRVRGMLLHMAGHWQLFVDAYGADGRKERTRFDLEL